MLVYTALAFLTNAIHAFLKQKSFYAIAFLLLATSSVLLRSVPEENVSSILYFDLTNVFIVIAIGLFYFLTLKLDQQWIPLSFFLVIVYLYGIGYIRQCHCWDPDKQIGQHYQGIVHLLSSIGHHCILYCL